MSLHRTMYLTLLSVLLIFALSAIAKEQAPAAGEEPPRRSGMMMCPQERLDSLSKELNLTDAQKVKIKPLLEDETKQMQALREDTSMSPQDRRSKDGN